MKIMKKKNMESLFLILGTFFNPLGYDALLKWVMNMTGSYWFSILIFYLISLFCFIIYFFLAKINPFSILKRKIKF